MTDEQAIRQARDEEIRRILHACRATDDGRTGTHVTMGFEALYEEIGVLHDALVLAQRQLRTLKGDVLDVASTLRARDRGTQRGLQWAHDAAKTLELACNGVT